jgi:flavin-dependent dehydrogenase
MARWGSAAAHCREAILDPYGCGWHLDRRLFERQLIAAAVQNGAALLDNCAQIETEAIPTGWQFQIERAGRQIGLTSNYAVDCTGRSARLAVKAGARRIIHDKLVAMWGIREEGREDADRRIYIEAAPDGWLYSAQIPNRRRVVAFFTDGDLCDLADLRSAASFARYIARSCHLSAVTDGLADRIVAGPFRVNAASTRLVRAFGERWIAAGDAAQAFDPLSSQGIMAAILGGHNAAAALIAAHSGDHDSPEQLQADLDGKYAAYLVERQAYYRAEQRWREWPFWQRRHRDVSGEAKASRPGLGRM